MLRMSLLLMCFVVFAFACEGDCIKCHPILVKNGSLDKNHKILANCKNCHKTTSTDMEKMGSLCGEDCWQCHSVKKVMTIPIKEHLALNNCIKCHKKLNNIQIPLSIDKNGFTQDSFLKSILK